MSLSENCLNLGSLAKAAACASAVAPAAADGGGADIGYLPLFDMRGGPFISSLVWENLDLRYFRVAELSSR